jgi:hypothetical protein
VALRETIVFPGSCLNAAGHEQARERVADVLGRNDCWEATERPRALRVVRAR